MKPISNIHTLIESSNLQYLHPKMRRNIIENSTHWEICSINKKVSDIFLWEDFLKSHYHTGDSYTNMLLSSKFFDTSKDIMEILMNPKMERIFYFPTDYFTWLMSLCTNKADFIDMCHLPIVRNTIFLLGMMYFILYFLYFTLWENSKIFPRILIFSISSHIEKVII